MLFIFITKSIQIIDDIIKSSNNKIIYLSQRARANEGIENIYMMGKEERNRYRILEDNINSTNISIIIYEGNENYWTIESKGIK